MYQIWTTSSPCEVVTLEVIVTSTDDAIAVMPQACNFIKKETLAQVFFCEFCEISKNTFFTEHLWATASHLSKFVIKKS